MSGNLFFNLQRSIAKNLFFNAPHLTRSITVMRHSESTWNVAGYIQGRSSDPSIVLTPAGRSAARSLFASVPKPDILITSPLLRCIQTAEAGFSLPFDKLPMLTRMNPYLLEIHAGDYEGRLIKDQENDPLWQIWMKDPTAFPGFPGGETLVEFQNRVLQGLGIICSEHGDANKQVLVITHGVVMRVLKCFLADQSLDHLWKHQVSNLEQIHLTPAQIIQFQQYNDRTVPRYV